LFLGIGATGLGYIAWFDALKTISAAKAGAFIYLEPLVAIVLSFFILGEALTISTILGGLLILLGVWIVTYSKKALLKSDNNIKN
jgi:drug/metabolite transporter (DMT)-like permease